MSMNTSAPTVQTTSGVLTGERLQTVRRWLGVPYALPLTPKRRWRAAEPVHTPNTVRHCTAYGHICWQPQVSFVPRPPGVEAGEECLNLNIWAPDERNVDALPVMVFIHGGASLIGFSAQRMYDGAALSANGNVIVVTLNYRLGAFGALDFTWLNNPLSDDEAFESNLGLRDVVTALRWVRDNIASFGGDPENVTLFGESAGGAAVTTLMTVPSAHGLFHRAIAQSAPATSVHGTSMARLMSETFLRIAGIDPGAPDAAQRLKNTPPEELAAHNMTLVNQVAETMPGTLAFAPVVDGVFLPDHPAHAFERGDQANVPLIIGTNKNEAALFKLIRSPIMPRTSAQVSEMLTRLATHTALGDAGAARIRETYLHRHSETEAMRLSTDAGFRLPAIWFATAHSRIADTFMYLYEFSMPLPRVLGFAAMHGAELPYVFGTLPIGRPKPPNRWVWWGSLKRARTVSAMMQTFWSRFAHTGNPSANGDTLWPRYATPGRETMVFDARPMVVNDPDATKRATWPSEPLLIE